MSSLSYISNAYSGKPSMYTSSVQSFKEYIVPGEYVVVRSRNWWAAFRLSRLCEKRIDKSHSILREVR